MKLKAGLIGGTIGEAFQDAQGQTTLDMIVKGTVDDPQVTSTLKDTGKKVLNVVKEKLGDHSRRESKGFAERIVQ